MELFSLEAAWHIGKQMSNQPFNLAIDITILIWRQKYEKWLRCSFCSSWCICKAIQRVSEDWLLHDPNLLAVEARIFFKNLTALIRSCLCKQLRWHWRLTGCCRHGGPGTDKHCYSFLQSFSLECKRKQHSNVSNLRKYFWCNKLSMWLIPESQLILYTHTYTHIPIIAHMKKISSKVLTKN